MRKEKGITLIALVITIIVLLILAAVSILTLTGENGILTQAQNAKKNTSTKGETEQIQIAYTEAKTKKIQQANTTDVTATELQAEITYDGVNATVTEVTGEDETKSIKVVFPETEHSYNVDGKTGEITEITE